MPTQLESALVTVNTQTGESLAELSDRSPLLVVLLRHSGCAFCREALSDLAGRRAIIERQGTRIVVVHFGLAATMNSLLIRYGLADIDRAADPDRRLYQALELRRAHLAQLLGPRVIWRGFAAAILSRHWFWLPKEDPRQMPGAFQIHRRQVIRAFRHRTAADRPNYGELACPVGSGAPIAS